MNVFLVFLTLVISRGAWAEATKAPVKAEAAKAPVKAELPANEVKVGVKGMVCAFCAQGIEKSFKAQKEVAGVEVSLENKYVKIKFKDGQKLSNEKIATILKDAGYEAVFAGS